MTFALKSLSVPTAIQENEMPDKRPNFKPVNLRLDLDTYKVLLALQELYGTRKNRSDLIRDAIVEKYERDRKTLTKSD